MAPPLSASSWLALAGFVALSLGVGAAGSLATSDAVREWYPTLAKPEWTPPNWLFGPVWTTLYVAIGVSGWLVWRAGASRQLSAWRLWWTQLALNAAWSPVFFGLHQVALGVPVILTLLAAIVAFVAVAWRPHRAAALAFLPYAGWVSYASALNIAIWLLNR